MKPTARLKVDFEYAAHTASISAAADLRGEAVAGGIGGTPRRGCGQRGVRFDFLTSPRQARDKIQDPKCEGEMAFAMAKAPVVFHTGSERHVLRRTQVASSLFVRSNRISTPIAFGLNLK